MAFTNLSTRATGYLVTATNWNEMVNNWLAVATSAGLLKHEYGGMEVDISGVADGGIMRGTGSGVWAILAAFLDTNGRVKHEYGGIEANISAIVAGGLLNGTGTGTMGILAKGTALQHLRVNAGATALEWATPTAAALATGTYTGDGSTSQAITGVGFTVKYLKIWDRITAINTGTYAVETTDTIMDDDSDGWAMRQNVVGDLVNEADEDLIIALGADGFTVDDQGADNHPNKNGNVYNYLALG